MENDNMMDKKIISFNLYNKAKPLEYNVALYVASVGLKFQQNYQQWYKSKKFIPNNIYDNVGFTLNKMKSGLVNNYFLPYVINLHYFQGFLHYKHLYSRGDYLPATYILSTQQMVSNQIYNSNTDNPLIVNHKITSLNFQYYKSVQNNYREWQVYSDQFETGLFNELNEFTLTFTYYIQPQRYGIVDERSDTNVSNYISNYMFPHYTSILDDFIMITDNKLEGNPNNDTTVTFDVVLFNDVTFSFGVDMNIDDLYFIIKYNDNNITFEVYNITVTRTHSGNSYTINANHNKIYENAFTLSKDILELCDISKARLSMPAKISNIRFIPLNMDDFFIKDFETLENDGMQYHF